MGDRPIVALLRELGLEDPASQAAARRILEAAGLTRPGKVNMARTKEERAAKTVRQALAFHCGAEPCRADLAAHAGERTLLLAARSACEVCGGATNRRAITAMAQTLRQAGLSRVLVVGGSPALHQNLLALTPPEVQVRLVEGTGRANTKTANQDLAWAQVVVIWGGATQLDHKVSDLYTSSPLAFTVPRRGVAALAQAVCKHVARR